MKWLRHLRAGWQRLPESEVALPSAIARQVAVRAIIAGTLLLAVLAILSRLMENPVIRFQVDHYVRLGVRGGAAALRDDLLMAHPMGSPIGGVISQMTRMGFQCPAIDPAIPVECRFRAKRAQDGQVATIIVLLTHDGASFGGVEASMRVDPR